MKILITNDDGIKSENLKVLVEEIVKRYEKDEIIVVAPEVEQSGVSHSLEIKNPVHIYHLPDMCKNVKTYMVDSTPVECILMAKNELNYDFDIVFSGVNNGYNLGCDVMYSGTCAAALEALYYCNTSVAFSVGVDSIQSFIDGVDTFFKFFNKIKEKQICLNVNFPKDAKGIKLAAHDSSYKELSSDKKAKDDGYIVVTPLRVDLTDYDMLAKLKNIK